MPCKKNSGTPQRRSKLLISGWKGSKPEIVELQTYLEVSIVMGDPQDGWFTSGNLLQFAIEHGPCFLLIYLKMVTFNCELLVYQRVNWSTFFEQIMFWLISFSIPLVSALTNIGGITQVLQVPLVYEITVKPSTYFEISIMEV